MRNISEISIPTFRLSFENDGNSMPIEIRGTVSTLFRAGSTTGEIITQMHEEYCNGCPVRDCSLHPTNEPEKKVNDEIYILSRRERMVVTAYIPFSSTNLEGLRHNIKRAVCIAHARFQILTQMNAILKNRLQPPPNNSA